MQKVLIILHSEDFRLALQEALALDYDVMACADPIVGLELIQQQPDILILDLLMPGMDGLTFLQRLGDYKLSKIIILTSFISSPVLDAMADLSVNSAIRKPCPVSAVVSRLKL